MEPRRSETSAALLKIQEAKRTALSLQSAYNEAWLRDDSRMIDTQILSYNFIKYPDSLQGEQASFSITESDLAVAFKTDGDWQPCVSGFSGCFGVRDKVVKVIPEVNIRALAIELKLEFLMLRNSSFWIVSRARNFTDSNSAICRLKSWSVTNRLYLSLGSPTGSIKSYSYFKQKEVGCNSPEEYLPISLTFRDNGNDRVDVIGTVDGDEVTKFSTSCSMFIPTFEPFHVFLASNGLVKLISLEAFYKSRSFVAKSEGCCAAF